jgi:hypothetical protein
MLDVPFDAPACLQCPPQLTALLDASFCSSCRYKGEWKARQIDNPDFRDSVAKYTHEYVGFELWTGN